MTDKNNHKHRADRHADSVYEHCSCGAVRRKDRPGQPRDDWHVCDVCRRAEVM